MDAYPKNTKEFEAFFKNDEDCLRHILSLRWPDGYGCPACHSRRKSWLKSNGKIKCADCGRSLSVTSGTVFQDSHTPLLTWFRVMWHLRLQKNGISALSLQRSLGLGTCQTSWLCLHKLRKAMVRPGRGRLSWTVEVDETYIGGTREGKGGVGRTERCLCLSQWKTGTSGTPGRTSRQRRLGESGLPAFRTPPARASRRRFWRMSSRVRHWSRMDGSPTTCLKASDTGMSSTLPPRQGERGRHLQIRLEKMLSGITIRRCRNAILPSAS